MRILLRNLGVGNHEPVQDDFEAGAYDYGAPGLHLLPLLTHFNTLIDFGDKN
ncbi:MAG: hypothetical protein PHS86_02255 [Syntrophaceae bacterium]|nr:hypothetical protein [Syntrophaceae bacterium]